VIAAAGRVDASGDVELRRRLGAISTMKGLRYWSVSEGGMRELVKDAAALSGAEGGRRDDFAPGDIRAGAVLYFLEEDNRSSEPVTYRMRVLEATPDRIVAETENVTPIKAFVTLFPPGAFRAAYFMTRVDARTWSLYAVSAATDRATKYWMNRPSHALAPRGAAPGQIRPSATPNAGASPVAANRRAM